MIVAMRIEPGPQVCRARLVYAHTCPSQLDVPLEQNVAICTLVQRPAQKVLEPGAG